MRNIKIILLILMVFSFFSCQKEKDLFGDKIDETIYLRSLDCDMPIRIIGNTNSKVLILFVHGGPGHSDIYQPEFFLPEITNKYSLAFWDQNRSGSSQSTYKIDYNVKMFTDDLEKVVQLLTSELGDDMEIYLWSHSWGGMLSAIYFSEYDYPHNVKGWINMDGASCPQYLIKFEQIYLIKFANQEISAGNNIEAWTKALDFCNEHSVIDNIDDGLQLNKFCRNGQNLLSEVNRIKLNNAQTIIFGQNSIMSNDLNTNEYFFPQCEIFEEITMSSDLTENLPKITIPTQILWGKYDIQIPIELADTIFNSISSSIKEKVIFDKSDHNPYLREPQKTIESIINFIEKTK